MDEHNNLVKDNGSSQVLNCEPQEDNNGIQQLHQPFVENPNISQTKGRPPKDDKGKRNVQTPAVRIQFHLGYNSDYQTQKSFQNRVKCGSEKISKYGQITAMEVLKACNDLV
ncbi:hypothetical protein C5167_026483 [Papaver somniferum]|nr:hypothetical protein C5167_026483 [Papaver somniferum]